MSEQAPLTRQPSETSEAFRCLVDAGVSERKAAGFLARARCTTTDEVALFLRMQLPPLRFANAHAVDTEMRTLLGVTGERARALLQKLDVLGVFPKCGESPSVSACSMIHVPRRALGPPCRALVALPWRSRPGSARHCALYACARARA